VYQRTYFVLPTLEVKMYSFDACNSDPNIVCGDLTEFGAKTVSLNAKTKLSVLSTRANYTDRATAS
jgi:hypothetical protein